MEDPVDWSAGAVSAEFLLALPALWWPPPEGELGRADGCVLQGIPGPEPAAVEVPVVAGIDLDLLREGEPAEIDGSDGTVTLPGVREVEVVTSILQRDDGRVLLLERSDQVGSFRGRWAGVSGYLEDPTPFAQAVREIREETGFAETELALAAAGEPVYSRDGGTLYIVHPFRFRVERDDVRLDWEHRRAEWVDPAEIRRRETVPKLDRVWERVAPSAAPKR